MAVWVQYPSVIRRDFFSGKCRSFLFFSAVVTLCACQFLSWTETDVEYFMDSLQNILQDYSDCYYYGVKVLFQCVYLF